MEKYQTLKDKKDYEQFVADIPLYLNNLSQLVSKPHLMYDEEEVRYMSRYFIELNKKALFFNMEKRMFIIYLGEAFKTHFGGEWAFTGRQDSYAINEPVIVKYRNEGIRHSPSEVIFSLLQKEDENYFNWLINYMKEFDKKTEEVFAKIFPKRRKNMG